jgi:glycosyltransferase involved in cell wall biosynthesis
MRRILIDDPRGPLGAVCDPSSVESIADAIRSIIRLEPSKSQEMRDRCRQAAAERWNWPHEAKALLGVYSMISPHETDHRPVGGT